MSGGSHTAASQRAMDLAGGFDEPKSYGTSIFDPVLCELAYSWFCPAGGVVLDPFAGGSVRGIVASRLGHPYVGVELSGQQVDENRRQAAEICASEPTTAGDAAGAPAGHVDAIADVTNAEALTPVERRGDVLVKRDDAFTVAGVRGGKARTCRVLAEGATGLVTAGSRSSPQANIVARIAASLGVPCRVHTPSGVLSPELLEAQDAGAEVVQHRAGHNSVIVARAREDAERLGWTSIPFGMECEEAVTQTRRQVVNLPAEAKRLVVPVGSGMSLAGILWGLRDEGRAMPVVGVTVGADPRKRLDRYAPSGWRDMVTLVDSGSDYATPAAPAWHGMTLDPHYEAKCVPHLEADDLLWVVGIRRSETGAAAAERVIVPPVWHEGDSRDIRALVGDVQADLVLSCPPYADLEVYSDHPADISNMDYPDFLAAYRTIIAETCSLLREDRFAVFVVGEARDRGGYLYGLIPDTVDAFRDAGLRYYNDAVLLTAIGSTPVRAAGMFRNRKLGRVHQNVLVFVKGDARRAAAACDPVRGLAELDAYGGADGA